MTQARQSEFPLRAVVRDDATGCPLVVDEETDQSNDDSVHVPERIPTLRMIVAHAHANSCVFLEAATGRNHRNGGRLVRVLFREVEAAEVEAALVRAVLQSEDEIIPAENVVRVWTGEEILKAFFLPETANEVSMLDLETLNSLL